MWCLASTLGASHRIEHWGELSLAPITSGRSWGPHSGVAHWVSRGLQGVCPNLSSAWQIAARTLGDLVRKLGEKILPEIIPILEEGLRSPKSDERQGVCIGLSEIMKSTSRDAVSMSSGPEGLPPTPLRGPEGEGSRRSCSINDTSPSGTRQPHSRG